ncbi:UDP-N-acetylmuramoyl-tripeptide--D-alanyl-D-alanine ligase, partial [Ectothiorhodospiraceae bacterium WFHF3C12]|nr:UDP-N-acetylmuramoyl-tripeptide--D-alanyl-D-alanine ligase [Ectothiorhodospiraceae bacterium WFHF3C12]
PLPQIQVGDVADALWAMAGVARAETGARIVGLTGSNGKTTVKEMLASILGRVGPTWWTRGNLNNELGVPLTLCRLNPEHRFAVIEMGANHHGEIRHLCGLVRPHVGLVTNAGAAHLEGFGSVRGVAEAKGEIYETLAPDATAVINVDDHFAGYWLDRAAPRRCMSFSYKGPADVWAEDAGADGGFMLRVGDASRWVNLPLPGRHNVMNALAAATAATALGASVRRIAEGLESVRPVAGRLCWSRGKRGLRLLDDTYNANPNSLQVALDVLAAAPGPHWVVLGDMGELGDTAETLHGEAGETIRRMGVARLFTTGPNAAAAARAFGEGARHFENQQDLIGALSSVVTGREAVLVKGSRSMVMERVVAGLQQGADSAASGEG